MSRSRRVPAVWTTRRAEPCRASSRSSSVVIDPEPPVALQAAETICSAFHHLGSICKSLRSLISTTLGGDAVAVEEGLRIVAPQGRQRLHAGGRTVSASRATAVNCTTGGGDHRRKPPRRRW